MGRQRRTSRATAATITAAASLLALTGCALLGDRGYRSEGYSRRPILGGISYLAADHTLHMESCRAEFRVTESPHQVTLVYAGWNFPLGEASLSDVGAACRVYDFALALHAPLGSRRVVDGTTGNEIPVSPYQGSVFLNSETPAPSLPAG